MKMKFNFNFHSKSAGAKGQTCHLLTSGLRLIAYRMPLPLVTICRSASELESIQPLWELLLTSREYTVFQNFRWNRAAAALFAQREAPLVVAVESASGAAIIPAVFRKQQDEVSLLGEELFDYRECLWTGDASVLRYGWQTIAALGKPFRMRSVRGHAAGHWDGFSIKPFTRAMSSQMADPPPRPSKATKQLQRLQEMGCSVETLPATAERVEELYSCRSEVNGDCLFRDQLRRKMVARMAAESPEGAELHLLTHRDQFVAGAITFRDREWRRFYGTHYSQTWSRYSPGMSLVCWMRDQSLASGLNFDYMTGEQPYKVRLASSAVPLYQVTASAAQLAKIAAGDSEPLAIAA
jgi:CelD/BcsL family acetyltransferase involved in cellulose biosynthesis